MSTAQLPSRSFILLGRRPFAERGLCPIKEPMVSRLKHLCWNLLWKSCLCCHLGKKVFLSFELGAEGWLCRGGGGCALAVEFHQCFLKPRLSPIHPPARVWLCHPQTEPAGQPEVCIENLIPACDDQVLVCEIKMLQQKRKEKKKSKQASVEQRTILVLFNYEEFLTAAPSPQDMRTLGPLQPCPRDPTAELGWGWGV